MGMTELLAELTQAMPAMAMVRIRGHEVRVRALTAREIEAILGIFLRPGAPMIPRPGTHPETGPLFAHTEDPRYMRDLEIWVRRERSMEVAAAAEMRGFSLSMGPAQLEKWGAQVSADLGVLSDAELIKVWNTVRELSDPVGEEGERIEAAKKALSGLSREEALAIVNELFPDATG